MELTLLCVKIFCARILDVSLGTIRTIFTVKGKNFFAAIMGFLEICIWFTIVREALNTDQSSIFILISYAGGFAAGTFMGGKISSKVIKTNFTVQIITSNESLAKILRDNGYAVTMINVIGKDEKDEKYMLYIEIKNKSFTKLQESIYKYDEKAFVVVNEAKYVQNGFIK